MIYGKEYDIYLSHRFVSPGLRPLAADKTGFNLKIFSFDIRGKLSIIRCDKYILKPKNNWKFVYVLLFHMGISVNYCSYESRIATSCYLD